MSDILLIFPPLANHEHPHLGLPMIKGYLNNNGWDACRIIDYNVSIMDTLFKTCIRDNSEIFGNTGHNFEKIYTIARRTMQGSTNDDKLKSGWAMEMIAKYLRMAGRYIYENSFDPISFKVIEETFKSIDFDRNKNVIITYLRNEVLPDILKYKPKVIGFSVTFSTQILYTMLLCNELKKQLKDTKIVLGGTQVSLFWKPFINSDYFSNLFDCIVQGQGENAFVKLLNVWINNCGSYSDVPNLIYKNKTDRMVVTNPIDSRMVNMNDIGTPDFKSLPLEKYAYPILPYMMTRGCYWGECTFCGYRGCNTQYISSTKEKVVNDLQVLKETYNIRIFHLMDDVILPNFLVQIAKMIIGRKLDISYDAYLRAEKAYTADKCSILYKSGLRSVLFGFESANPRVLKLMNKGLSLDVMRQIFRNFKEAGIANYLSCIIGFPTETEDEAYDTIHFLLENKNIYHQAFFGIFRLFADMVIDHSKKYSIRAIDTNNPSRHDLNGYLSLEYSYHADSGMSIHESVALLQKARKMIGSVPEGPNVFR